MKILLLCFFLVGCHSFGVKNEATPKSISFTNLLCKQKILPIKIDYLEEKDKITIQITPESALKDFQLTDIRGLDGLTVIDDNRPEVKDLSPREVVEFEVDVTKPEGLAYLALDVEAKLNGLVKKQALVIPTGKLTDAQKQERKKNIRTESEANSEFETRGSKSSVTPKDRDVHVLKIE